MGNRHTKVIGYFSYLSRMEILCTDSKACIISGSYSAMEEYISEITRDNIKEHSTIKKTRFGEISQGLHHRSAYAFDEKSYPIFFIFEHFSK